MSLDPAAYTLHRPPALFVAEVLRVDATGGQVRLTNQHGLDALQLVEGCAQAIAVIQGASAIDIPPVPGALAAVTAVGPIQPARPGEIVVVTVTGGVALGHLRQWSVTASSNGVNGVNGKSLLVATMITAITP